MKISIIRILFLIIKVIFNSIKKTLKFIHEKKPLRYFSYFLIFFILFIFIIIKTSGDNHFNRVLSNYRTNDVTQLNPIKVEEIYTPKTESEIIEIVKKSSNSISIGGGKFSMGGQTSYENSTHLDLRKYNKILKIDTTNKKIVVQSGAIWRDIQEAIDPYNLSVKIMQTYSNFTVGGSISVNCHGRYIGYGPIVFSVNNIRMIMADGSILNANRNENLEVFKAVIGGYGGIGVISEIELQLAENVKVKRYCQKLKVSDYNKFFDDSIKSNKKVVFQNGDLYPPNYEQINNVAWIETNEKLTNTNRITPRDENYWLEQKMVKLVSKGKLGKYVRQYIVDPIIYSKESVVWRNKEASYNVKELEPKSREKSTYVLQEYFIPKENMEKFIPKMKSVYEKYNVNVLNVSLRHAYPDTTSYLSWARQEMFAFVVYYKQNTDEKSKDVVRSWTKEMSDSILSCNGAWYLPYQPHATIENFKKAYPKSNKYFEVKRKYDPENKFVNKLLEKYDDSSKNIFYKRALIENYYKSEEQGILSIPEWYLVFNPIEYTNFIKTNNPSNFDYFGSIQEYWKLYDRSKMLVSKNYPSNEEYVSMLNIIGISFTVEYTLKGFYEKTIGRFFSLFFNGQKSDEEQIIEQANQAYCQFIFDEPWYKFNFLHWVKKIGSVSNTQNSNFVRKWERISFFTMEFLFKALYAQLLEWGAKMAYDEPIVHNYVILKNGNINTQSLSKVTDRFEIIQFSRWGKFTNELLNLTKNKEVVEISGNKNIMVSIVGYNVLSQFDSNLIFESNKFDIHKMKRFYYYIPTDKIQLFKEDCNRNNMKIEHFYDF
jgi:FAD/FMN-containing dehydrogenase